MSDSESDRDEVEEYDAFAQPTLIDQLKKILDEYPDDGQIIKIDKNPILTESKWEMRLKGIVERKKNKELIQNADDAGAKHMKILYIGDEVNPLQDGEKKYRKFLGGPALVFYNDARFSQDDWTGIRTIYNSVKADDPLTVGRFGLGFKSVFHITDYPCIVSGDKILFLNPLEKKSHKVCVTISLKRLHLSKTIDTADVLAALDGVFGFNDGVLQGGSYPGTIFWFPLRSRPTKLSANIYEEHRVLELFNAFMADSEMSLLFLKGLQNIKLHCKMEKDFVHHSMQSKTRLSFSEINFGVDESFYSVELQQISSSNSESKVEFIEEIKSLNGSLPERSMTQLIGSSINMTKKSKNQTPCVTKQKWFTLNLYPKSPDKESLKILIEDKDLCYSPLVAVSVCIEQGNDIVAHRGGKIFCFQPLPEERENRTGLPVHINGFFALTQNRRHIKLPSSDQEHFNMHLAKPIQWNIALMNDILPEAYVKLVLGLIDTHGKNGGESLSELVYNILPDFTTINPKWNDHAERVFRLLLEEKVLYTKANGGEWISAEQAVFAPLDCMEAIKCLLIQENIRLVLVPSKVLKAIEERTVIDLTKASPRFITKIMSHSKSYKTLSLEQKMELLVFLHDSDCANELHSFELMPQEDGEFSALGYGKDVFTEEIETVKLFPHSKQRFVSRQIAERDAALFENIASKGLYKVKKLDARATVSLIEEMLEVEFETSNPPLKVDKTRSNQYKTWLQKIWTLITERFMKEIKEFECLPLFPVSSKKTWSKVQSFQLYPTTSLFISNLEKEDKTLPVEVFKMMSVNVIHSLPEWFNQSIIDQYVYRCTGSSLTKLVARLDNKDLEYFNLESDASQRKAFLEFLCPRFSKDMLHDNVILVLRRLKIFKVKHSNMIESDFQHVSANESNGVLACFDFPVKFPYPLLDLTKDKEKFINLLGVFEVSANQMILDTFKVITKYTKEEIITLMLWVLCKQFHEQSFEIAAGAKEVRFLTAEYEMKKPCDLFDPSDKLLVSIFNNFNIFPTDSRFITPKLLPALRELGMKSRQDVSREDIYNACKRIHESGSYKKESNNGQIILNFLETNVELLKKSQVNNLKWIPVQDGSKSKIFQYNKGRGTLVSPSEVKSSRFKYLIGCHIPVIDSSNYSNLADHFKWNDPPPVEDVNSQLHKVVTNYSDTRKADCLSLTIRIYEWLADQSSTVVKQSLEEEFGFDGKYVWNGNGFCSCNQVVVTRNDRAISLEPFLWYLPPELKDLKGFFIKIGCLETVNTTHYISVLEQMKNDIDLGSNSNTSTNCLRLAINILNIIKEEIESGSHISNCDILVPLQTDRNELILKPARKCTYGSQDESIEEGFLCVHEAVPLATAQAVGVQSFKQQMMSELEGIEEWGQTEPLTRRLHNLLKEGYVDGFSVPKELFQNADDAKASKLWLLYDERENLHARTNLLNDAMEEVQGPALWVYNDAKFTEADFKSITKLSGATKKPDASKIGKFGLGFCSVYNLTDVPSFLSGDSIVIFDPHTDYLGNALPGRSPGLRINLRKEKNRKMVHRLRNQFLPFENIFGCKVLHEMKTYEGTLFRLPLRTRIGKISDVIYRKEEIQDLMDKIREFSSNLLIFSQNVHEIKLFQLRSDEEPSEMKQIFSSKKILESTIPRHIPHTTVLSEVCIRKKSGELTMKPLKRIEKIVIETKDYASNNTWKISWFVSWSTGSKEKSLELSKADEGAIPLAAAAIPVESENGKFSIKPIKDLPYCFYQKPHFFCILPLPLEHDFPIHINGQFAVSSDRRRFLTLGSEDRGSIYQEWNESLMEDAVVLAAVHMLENFYRLGAIQNAFHHSWPLKDKRVFEERFSRSFYQYIIRNDSKVFEKNGHWYSISKCVFLDLKLRSDEIGQMAFEILEKYSTDGVAMDFPKKYYGLLMDADNEAIKGLTIKEERFFLQYFLPNMKQFASSEVDKINALLKHAIKLNNKDIDEWMKSHESLPSSPNCELKFPSDIVDKTSVIGVLFKEVDGRFLLEDIAEGIDKVRLRSLGVLYNTLPDSLLLERALRVEALNTKCSRCAIGLCKELLIYFMANSSFHEKAFESLRLVKFLPISRKPTDWQADWEGDKMYGSSTKKTKLCKEHKEEKESRWFSFERAGALYSSSLKEIIGCNFKVLDAQACVQPEKIYVAERLLRKTLHLKCQWDVSPEMALEQIVVYAQSCKTNSGSFRTQEVYSDMTKVYRFLDDHDDLKQMQLAEMTQNVIWTSKKFSNIKDVAFSTYGLDCTPLLYDLENSPMKHCKKLCDKFNIQQTFALEELVGTLRSIAEETGGKEVEPHQRRAVINVIECIRNTIEIEKTSPSNLHEKDLIIFAPDEDWILRDSRNLCFNDESGLETGDGMILVNEELKIKTARTIGIKSKLHQIIQNTSDSVDSVEFFQDEPLVTRLNNILSGYPLDSGIFKELIQNADDAGAEEIHFLLDTESYGNDVFDNSYSTLQGPALCVYNDKPFTQNDLKGIQNLGKGSKGEDPSKTGQYGVGFNSVYNFTDSPSFLTKGPEIENGETLCIFDPMAKFLPHSLVSKEKPGRRFKDITTIRGRYKDLLLPYNESVFMKNDHGTIFRLPLRSKTKGYESDIKDENVSVNDVRKLFKEFEAEAAQNLIFLKHLRKIDLSIKASGCVSLVAEINLSLSDKDSLARKTYFVKHAELCINYKGNRNSIFDSQSLSANYEVKIVEKAEGNKSINETNYLVVQTIGYKDFHVPKEIQYRCKNGDIGLLPQGGVACYIPGPGYKQNRLSLNRAFCFLPLPGNTRLPVHVNGHFALDHEGRRGLWESDNFEDSMCYKTLWNKSLIEGVICPSYMILLDIIIKRIFAKLKEKGGCTDVKSKMLPFQVIRDAIFEYCSYLPSKDSVVDNYWMFLLKSIYTTLVKKDLRFLPTVISAWDDNQKYGTVWKASMKLSAYSQGNTDFVSFYNGSAHDLEMPVSFDEKKVRRGCVLTNILQNIGMNIVLVPNFVRESMKFSGFCIKDLDPRSIMKFLCSFNDRTNGCCSIQIQTPVQRTTVKSVPHIGFIISAIIKDTDFFKEMINHMPIFITRDNVVRLVSIEEPIFVTKFQDFFENVDHRFLCKQLVEIILKKEEALLQGSGLEHFSLENFKQLLKNSSLHCLETTELFVWSREMPDRTWIQRTWEFFSGEILIKGEQDKQNDLDARIEKFLNLFNETALVPATNQSAKGPASCYLVPPHEFGYLLDVTSFQIGPLKRSLEKLNLLAVQMDLFDNVDTQQLLKRISKQIPHSDRPDMVVRCLSLNRKSIIQAKLSSSEANSILEYLSENWESLVDTISLVKDLPLFTTFMNELEPLSSYQSCISLNHDEIPSCGLDKLSKKKNLALIKAQETTSALFQKLGIVHKTHEELYIELILPNQELMDRDDFYKHIEYICKSLLSDDKIKGSHIQKIIVLLKASKFIEIQGKLVSVAKLFNPRVKIFSLFCAKEELLPQHFDAEIFIKVFEKIGLQSNLTVELFERFAKEISKKGQDTEISQSVRNKSGRLLKEFMNIQDDISRKSSFQHFAKIPFVLPAKIPKGICDICESKLKEDRMVSFSESVFYDKMKIAWTACPILPETLKIKDKNVREQLEMRPEEFFKVFFVHCKNVGESIHAMLKGQIERNVVDNIEEVITCIYECLFNANTRNQVNPKKFKQLAEVPIVYLKDGPSIQMACRIVITCRAEEEIRPYLNQMPITLGKYSEVFQLIGAANKPTVSSYVSVLQCLKDKCKTDKILKPDLMAVKKAISNLLRQDIKESKEALSHHDAMYLPTLNLRMEDARTVVVSDNKYLRKRLGKKSDINYFLGLEQLEIKDVPNEQCLQFFKSLPAKLRPVLLSDIVEEDVDQGSFRERPSSLVRELESFVKSVMFSRGLMRIAKQTYKDKQRKFDETLEDSLAQQLQGVNLIAGSGMKTVLSLKTFQNGVQTTSKRVPQSEEAKTVHIEKESGKIKIYIEIDQTDWQADFQKVFASYLNNSLPTCLTQEMFLVFLDFFKYVNRPSGIMDMLDKKKVVSHTFKSNEEPSLFARPGEFVPIDLHQYLDNDFSVIYDYEYDCIAYELDDPMLEETENPEGVATYIFVRLIRKVTEIDDAALFDIYEVDIGQNETILLPTYRLFKFVRKSNTSTELVIYQRNSTDQATASSSDNYPYENGNSQPKQEDRKEEENVSIHEVCKEIKQTLIKAWQEDQTTRKRIVKRLFLKYHPDKNPGKEKFYTKVFQYLQQCLQSLEEGKPVKDYSDGTNSEDNQHGGNGSSSHSGYWRRHTGSSGFWDDFFDQFERRQRWERSSSSSRHRFGTSSSFYFEFEEREQEPYKWPMAARKWQNQAKKDFSFAMDCLKNTKLPAYNWICCILHQSAEKSLRAAWYAKDANKVSSFGESTTDLVTVAYGLVDIIRDKARQITHITRDRRRMTYPNVVFGDLPAELYSREDAESVLALTKQLIDLVSGFYIDASSEP